MPRLITHVINRQFAVFLVIGGLNTAFGFGLFALLLHLGLHYAVASLLATVAGVLFNFKTTGGIVFRSHDNRLVLRFVAAYGIGYLLNILGLRLLLAVGLNAYWAGAVLILPMALIMFALQRQFVFAVRPDNSTLTCS